MTFAPNPYPEYKDSGVSWLGEVPAHWALQPGFSQLAEKAIKNVGMVENQGLSLSYGRIVIKPAERLHGLVPESFETYQIVDPGDLIIRSTDLQNDWTSLRVGIVRDRGIITSAYLCLKAKGDLQPEYAFWLLHGLDVMKVFYGLGSGLRQNLSFGDFKRLQLYVPPSLEQAAIVRYLRRLDQLVRRFMVSKQRLIKLLEEQKQAIVNQAVTKGIDSTAPLKPSGIPWLGNIPEHWMVSRSKHLFSVSKELSRADDVQLSATQAYGVIPQAEYEERVGRRVVKISMHLEKRRHVERDDFVISMRSFQGGLERAWASGAIRSSYVVLRPTPSVDVEFFSYLLKSPAYIRALQSTADFIRDGQDLTFDNFCRVDLPLISLEEQRAIASDIDKSVSAITGNIATVSRELDLIREYRNRLVADVVTGKVDVREAAASLPEEDSQDETFLGNVQPASEGWLEDDGSNFEPSLEEVEV